jgi:hypothetical protein
MLIEGKREGLIFKSDKFDYLNHLHLSNIHVSLSNVELIECILIGTSVKQLWS